MKKIRVCVDEATKDAINELLETLPAAHCMRGFLAQIPRMYTESVEKGPFEDGPRLVMRSVFLDEGQEAFLLSPEAASLFQGEVLAELLRQLAEFQIPKARRVG